MSRAQTKPPRRRSNDDSRDPCRGPFAVPVAPVQILVKIPTYQTRFAQDRGGGTDASQEVVIRPLRRHPSPYLEPVPVSLIHCTRALTGSLAQCHGTQWRERSPKLHELGVMLNQQLPILVSCVPRTFSVAVSWKVLKAILPYKLKVYVDKSWLWIIRFRNSAMTLVLANLSYQIITPSNSVCKRYDAVRAKTAPCWRSR